MKELLLIFLIMASTSTSAALSKWVDANGQVHYSDMPPPAAAGAKKLRSSSGSDDSASQDDAARNTPAAPKTIAEREAELKKAQQEKKAAADKAAKEQADAETVKASCAAAQQNLRALQEGVRIMEIDANGERSYIDDERRQQNIAKAQQDISRYCK